jgi:hypothetical protein
LPAATQLVELTQEIACNGEPSVPGLGVGVDVHEVPFHISTRDCPLGPRPAAAQNVVLVHDTPPKSPALPRSRVSVQAEPLQSATNPPTEVSPTATQKVELTHDTPSSCSDSDPELGLGATDQDVPFQVSTRFNAGEPMVVL